MRNADKLAAAGGDAIIDLFENKYYSCPTSTPVPECEDISCRVCWVRWLRQEAAK